MTHRDRDQELRELFELALQSGLPEIALEQRVDRQSPPEIRLAISKQGTDGSDADS